MMNGLGAEFRPRASLAELRAQLSALRPVDQWILSRLSDTVTLCNEGFANFELTTATTALFNFWLYDLCDYYIEYLKPSFYEEENSEHRANSREILYTCLDVGLRLISPFMPFIRYDPS